MPRETAVDRPVFCTPTTVRSLEITKEKGGHRMVLTVDIDKSTGADSRNRLIAEALDSVSDLARKGELDGQW